MSASSKRVPKRPASLSPGEDLQPERKRYAKGERDVDFPTLVHQFFEQQEHLVDLRSGRKSVAFQFGESIASSLQHMKDVQKLVPWMTESLNIQPDARIFNSKSSFLKLLLDAIVADFCNK